MHILGIETSCDETAAAVIKSVDGNPVALSNVVSSQVRLHAKWGGVVPNLAAREHVKNSTAVLEQALRDSEVSMADIDAIAVTNGPGLIPALLVGTNFAKTLAYVLEKPLIGIHHIEGHIYANFLRHPEDKQTTGQFPLLVLVVSGGHTQLIYMQSHLKYQVVGQTLDDAVGEAFDKVARILNVGYPGGPAISAIAEEHIQTENEFQLSFPRPLLQRNDLNFSFSGLKTAVLYETRKNLALLKDKRYIAAVCKEFQQASIDVLISKTIKAAEKFDVKSVLLAGGVSANKQLRAQLGQAIADKLPSVDFHVPALEYTGDNAAMIAAAAEFRWQNMTEKQKKEAFLGWKTLKTDANLKLK